MPRAAMLLSLVLLIGVLPTAAFAADGSYVLMNIPYAAFYQAELGKTDAVDAVSAATPMKRSNGNLAKGSYHVGAEGAGVDGVIYPVHVSDLSVLDAAKEITDASSVDVTTTARGTLAGALFVLVMLAGAFPNGSAGAKRLMPLRGPLSILACILTLGHNIAYGKTYFVMLFLQPWRLPLTQKLASWCSVAPRRRQPMQACRRPASKSIAKRRTKCYNDLDKSGFVKSIILEKVSVYVKEKYSHYNSHIGNCNHCSGVCDQ